MAAAGYADLEEVGAITVDLTDDSEVSSSTSITFCSRYLTFPTGIGGGNLTRHRLIFEWHPSPLEWHPEESSGCYQIIRGVFSTGIVHVASKVLYWCSSVLPYILLENRSFKAYLRRSSSQSTYSRATQYFPRLANLIWDQIQPNV